MSDAHRPLAAVAAVVALVGTGCGSAPSPAGPIDADVTAIRALLDRVEQSFNTGNLDAFMPVFAKDAVVMGNGAPDVIGSDAIRQMYADVLAQVDMTVDLVTDELEVFGDFAYERGTYTLRVSDKKTGAVLQEVKNRHVHVFRRQRDGSWKTWRMMTNGADAPVKTP
jgi:uncharacterized protein (TIGR02246 family)